MIIDDDPAPFQLSIWTLYDSPADRPGKFVLRRWLMEGKEWGPTGEAYEADTPEPLRALMERTGLCCLPRFDEDEPHIVESWI